MPEKEGQRDRQVLNKAALSTAEVVAYLEERARLLEYIGKGENNPILGIPIVEKTELRTRLLQAGYTQLAIGHWQGSYVEMESLRDKQRFEMEIVANRIGKDRVEAVLDEQGYVDLTEEERLTGLQFRLYESNPYGLEPGLYPFSALPEIVGTHPADLPEGQDLLRDKLLADFEGLENLKGKLGEKGIEFLSFGSWEYVPGEHGTLYFYLNPCPKDQNRFNAGLYTLDQLEQWSEGKGPVWRETELPKSIVTTYIPPVLR